MTLRNNLADALAKLVCRLRGRHVMGGKYRNVVKGELYPCKPDIFAATYEPVDTDKGGGVMTTEVEKLLTRKGVFKGAHGLEGLLNSSSFWITQPHGTRLYYGDGAMDYLHIDVLRTAVEILRAADTEKRGGVMAKTTCNSNDRICPYCGYCYQPESGTYGEDERIESCDGCGRAYKAYDCFSVLHYAVAIDTVDTNKDA